MCTFTEQHRALHIIMDIETSTPHMIELCDCAYANSWTTGNQWPLIATQPEWKLFQSLKKQGGGVSVLLIFTFALLIYSLYHYEKNIVYCNCTAGGLYIFTAFRVIHHVYSTVAAGDRKTQWSKDAAHINLFVYCHKILIPVLFIWSRLVLEWFISAWEVSGRLLRVCPVLQFCWVFVAFCDGSFVHEGCTHVGNVLLQRFKLYDTYLHCEDSAYTSISANGRWIYGLSNNYSIMPNR